MDSTPPIAVLTNLTTVYALQAPLIIDVTPVRISPYLPTSRHSTADDVHRRHFVPHFAVPPTPPSSARRHPSLAVLTDAEDLVVVDVGAELDGAAGLHRARQALLVAAHVHGCGHRADCCYAMERQAEVRGRSDAEVLAYT